MKLNDMKRMNARKQLTEGTHHVIFESIRYIENEKDDIIGAWITCKGYQDIRIPVFEEINTQLDFFCEQLEVSTYDPEEINSKAGTEITLTRFKRETEKGVYINTSFNPDARSQEVPDLA